MQKTNGSNARLELKKKQLIKAEYANLRKSFDREVRRCKCRNWYSLHNNLLEECNVNANEFWKSIGKIGVNQCGKKVIPEKVISENGELSRDISEVLD